MYECLFVCHVGMSNENEGKCMEIIKYASFELGLYSLN